MPSAPEESPLLEGGSTPSSAPSFRQRSASNWDAFTDFALRDNILEIAVGFILASSFTSVVNSFVTNIHLPVVSPIPFISRNLDQKFVVLKHGETQGAKYLTKQQALDHEAVVWAWGSFVDKCMRLFIIALTLFLIARIYGWLSGAQVTKRQVKCKYCRKKISEKVPVILSFCAWLALKDNY